jgi:hypothetical protein
MTNENDGNSPPANAQGQPLPQSPVTPSAPQEDKMGKRSDSGTDGGNDKTIQLEQDIRSGEYWLIGISAAGVILNVVIALIYLGQLHEMRRATKASAKAADAATSAADTADKTLKEIRAGGTDTHALAEQAKEQAGAAKKIAEGTLAEARQLKGLVAASEGTLATNKKNFITEQRPYIWARPREVPIEAHKPMKWSVVFENYGRSPAINVRQCSYFDLINMEKSYEENENAVPPIEVQMTAMLPPAQTVEECVLAPWRTKLGSTIMPPQAPEFTTFASDRELSESDVKILNKRDGNAFVYGTFFYDDTDGNHYRSTFCSYRLATGAASYCPKWNEIK